MTRTMDGVMLLLTSSLAVSLLGKATLIAASGLVGGWLTRQRAAAVRHAVLAASLSALLALPIASLVIKPVHIALSVSTPDGASPSLFPEQLDAARPAAATTRDVVAASAKSSRGFGLSAPAVGLAVWIAGTLFFLLRMIMGLQQVRALRRSGLTWREGQTMVNRLAHEAEIHRRVELLVEESVSAPVTCGFFRPAIVLPPEAQAWQAEDLQRAIVHELEHVRRFDWTSHCLARIVCAVYWFHPLVWVAWRRLALEAERACDDAVLAQSEATAYADQLVGLARRLSAAQKSPALAMVNRSDLAVRVGAVLDGGRARGRAGVLLAGAACVAAATMVLALAPLRLVAAPRLITGGPGGSIPKWDSVSIQPCTNAAAPPMESRGEGVGQLTDRQTWNCVHVGTLINQAYSIFAGGQRASAAYPAPIERLPSWADSERYTIEARPQGHPTAGIVHGPMLQALLQERFGLKIHRETREGRVYRMAVAQGGSKLMPFQGGCTPFDLAHTPAAGNSAIQNPCRESHRSDGPNVTIDIPGLDLDSFAFYVARTRGFDGPVRNETGLTGYFHFHLEYSASNPAADGALSPSIFTAMEQQLGLAVKSDKGPREFLVVDRVERPAEN